MKIEEYIEKLNEEIDFEEDSLSDIAEDTPKELHINIMKALEENEMKRKSLFYRRHFALAAAVFIIVLFISGLKNFSNIVSPGKSAQENSRQQLSTAQDMAEKGEVPENTANSTKNSPIMDKGKGVFEIETQDRDIKEYLKSHGENIGDNIYSLNRMYFEELNEMINSKKLVLKELKDQPIAQDNNNSFNTEEYIIIKISN